jgi:hypothetical protein
MGIFDSIAGKMARLAAGNVSLEDARRRHARRRDMRTLFDYEKVRRDAASGKLSEEWRRWLHVVILTEAGTPVYTTLLTTLEDSDRPEFADFRTFVEEIWTKEESQHGDVCRAVGEAIGFDLDVSLVRRTDAFVAAYRTSCPPCKRLLGTAAYTVVQEEITYMAHRAYAECSGSEELGRIGRTIAAEERYHSLFYASRLREVIDVCKRDGMPEDEIFGTIATVVQTFNMPTEFHGEAYGRYVTPGVMAPGVAFVTAHMGEIKQKLGLLFLAAGGLGLVRAIAGRGFPMGKVEPEETAALERAALASG